MVARHGSPDGVAVQAGRRVQTLSPSALARLLDGTGVRHRIVIISACYSGVFLGPLANDDSLVITAADSEHSSFGCQDKVKWTYSATRSSIRHCGTRLTSDRTRGRRSGDRWSEAPDAAGGGCITKAVDATIAVAADRTRDLGGPPDTKAFTARVIGAMHLIEDQHDRLLHTLVCIFGA
jgi:hypothetical protein